MADVQRRTGEYTIPAKSTKLFTFWWPVDKNHPHDLDNAYFDVSIAPELDNENAVITPLVEVKRERTFFFDEPWRSFTNKTLWLTLQNDNDFPVKFLAAHVLIN
jgi:hypothetical protein